MNAQMSAIKTPRRRWRSEVAWISVYALLISVGVHCVLTLAFRVPARRQRNWPEMRPLVWIAQPRETADGGKAAGRSRSAGRHFAPRPPRYAGNAGAALAALARRPVSSVPLLLLRTTGDSHIETEATEPPQRQWHWRISCEGAVPAALAQPLDKLDHAPLEEVHVVSRPAIVSCTMVEPGALRSFSLVESSGNAAFDTMALKTLRAMPLAQGVRIHAAMGMPRTHLRFLIVIGVEAAR